MIREILPNGVSCLLRAGGSPGSAALHLVVKAGGLFDVERPGLARFTASTLMRGTELRSGQRLALDLDSAGASLAVASGVETVVLWGRARSRDLPLLVGAAAEVVQRPAFPPDEIEKVRWELITAARVSSVDVRQVAERAFRQAAYPSGHPHSRSPEGDEEVLVGASGDDLRSFHAAHYLPGATSVAVAGDFDPPDLLGLLRSSFCGWAPAGVWALPAYPRPALTGQATGDGPSPASRAGRFTEAVVAGKSQADIALGIPGTMRGDPDYYAVMMANLLLGQLGMMGRIGESVRERQGMAYYAHSELRAGLLPGPWWVRAGVNPSNIDRALAAILHEVESLQESGPQPDELADARRFLTGSLALRTETNVSMAQMLAEIDLYGLGLDFLERYPGIVEGVRADEITAAIRKFPSRGFVLAVAGPGRESGPAAQK